MFSVLSYELAKRLSILYESSVAQQKTFGMTREEIRDYFAGEFEQVVKRLKVEGTAVTTIASPAVEDEKPSSDEVETLTDDKFVQFVRDTSARVKQYHRVLRRRGKSQRDAVGATLRGIEESCRTVLLGE